MISINFGVYSVNSFIGYKIYPFLSVLAPLYFMQLSLDRRGFYNFIETSTAVETALRKYIFWTNKSV
jgi:hypothetical protein